MNARSTPSTRSAASPPALIGSFVTHLLVLVLLALLLRPAGQSPALEPDRKVVVVLREAAPAKEAIADNRGKVAASTETLPNEPVPTESIDPADSPPPTLDLPEPGTAPATSLPDPVDAGELARRGPTGALGLEKGLSPEDLKAIAADQALLKNRQPVGEPATLRVFGSAPLTGRRFVFVLDRSQSMGASGLGVLARARSELAEAIGSLEANHKFQIVAYNDRCVTLAERRLLPATPEHQQQVPEFIARLAAYGPTRHEAALVSALTFEPDVIVLLTDGGYPFLNDGQLAAMQAMAGNRAGRNGTQIHCIQFGSGPAQSANPFMNKLARQNSGTFRYVDVNEWER